MVCFPWLFPSFFSFSTKLELSSNESTTKVTAFITLIAWTWGESFLTLLLLWESRQSIAYLESFVIRQFFYRDVSECFEFLLIVRMGGEKSNQTVYKIFVSEKCLICIKQWQKQCTVACLLLQLKRSNAIRMKEAISGRFQVWTDEIPALLDVILFFSAEASHRIHWIIVIRHPLFPHIIQYY